MKTKALLFLFVFVSFLVTPSLVNMVKHNADISCVFSFAEEENKTSDKTGKKVDLSAENKNDFLLAFQTPEATFFDYYSLNLKWVYLNLISPPPEL